MGVKRPNKNALNELNVMNELHQFVTTVKRAADQYEGTQACASVNQAPLSRREQMCVGVQERTSKKQRCKFLHTTNLCTALTTLTGFDLDSKTSAMQASLYNNVLTAFAEHFVTNNQVEKGMQNGRGLLEQYAARYQKDTNDVVELLPFASSAEHRDTLAAMAQRGQRTALLLEAAARAGNPAYQALILSDVNEVLQNRGFFDKLVRAGLKANLTMARSVLNGSGGVEMHGADVIYAHADAVAAEVLAATKSQKDARDELARAIYKQPTLKRVAVQDATSQLKAVAIQGGQQKRRGRRVRGGGDEQEGTEQGTQESTEGEAEPTARSWFTTKRGLLLLAALVFLSFVLPMLCNMTLTEMLYTGFMKVTNLAANVLTQRIRPLNRSIWAFLGESFKQFMRTVLRGSLNTVTSFLQRQSGGIDLFVDMVGWIIYNIPSGISLYLEKLLWVAGTACSKLGYTNMGSALLITKGQANLLTVFMFTSVLVVNAKDAAAKEAAAEARDAKQQGRMAPPRTSWNAEEDPWYIEIVRVFAGVFTLPLRLAGNFVSGTLLHFIQKLKAGLNQLLTVVTESLSGAVSAVVSRIPISAILGLMGMVLFSVADAIEFLP